jgi:hypothetical protein
MTAPPAVLRLAPPQDLNSPPSPPVEVVMEQHFGTARASGK